MISGFDGDGAGDAEALLLAARQAERAGVQAVLHFFPKGGRAQAAFDNAIEFRTCSDALEPQAVGDVLVDGLGERIGALEHHADAPAQFDDIHLAAVDVVAGDADAAFDADVVNQVVHAVEAPQEGGLTATGRSDEGGNQLFADE